MSTEVAFDEDLLQEIAGPVGAREYHAALDSKRPELWAWITKVRDLSDGELFDECRHWIYEGALVQRFNFNFEDVHCRGTVCYREAQRRFINTHKPDCDGSSIYGRAHDQAMRDSGYEPLTPARPCTCRAALSEETR